MQAPTPSAERALHAGIALALLAATLVTFAPALDQGFVDYDDDRYVTRNPALQLGLSREGIAWAFSTAGAPRNTYWHPLTWLTYLADAQQAGLSPRRFHATNLALHGLNALLAYAALATLTRSRWRSALVAGLFALHPLQVEAVAWISERKELLCTAFSLAALLAYARWCRGGGRAAYLACALALACALMSKPMAVTLPCLLLLLDFWPLRRLGPRLDALRARVLEKLPLFALSAASIAITLAVQSSGYRGGVSLPDRLANAAVSYARYLRKLVWPDDLAVLYPHPYIPEYGLAPWTTLEVAGATGLLALLSLLALRRRPATVGWLWFVGGLVPVIGIVQHAPIAMADRYAYLPMVGICVAAVWTVGDWLERPGPSRRGARALAALVAGALLVACGFGARAQLAHWRDSTTLFRRALAVTPENQETLFLLGFALARSGDDAGAIARYRRALEIGPGYAELYYNLGGAYARRGELALAEAEYRAALAAPRRHPHSRFGRGQILVNLAAAIASQGRYAEAVPHFEQALQQQGMGGSRSARLALAEARLLAGDAAGALRDYDALLAIDPENARVRSGRERALAGAAPPATAP